MRKTFFISLMCSLFVATHVASADLLCVQRQVEAKRGDVALSAAMKMAINKCPRGFVKVLDTAQFKGENGKGGFAGAKYSDCLERPSSYQKINLPAQKEPLKASASCSSGEYLHSFRMTTTYTYSSNWNFNSGDTDMAGQTYQAPTVGEAHGTILDENGFRSGFSFEVGGVYAHSIPGRNQANLRDSTFIGSVNSVADVKLQCCAIGE